MHDQDIEYVRVPLQPGLPQCLERDDEGFRTLKTKLNLNHDRCKSLLERALARKHIGTLRANLSRKKLRPGERDRLLLTNLYGDKGFRTDVWSAAYHQRDPGTDSSGDPDARRISLEYQALAPYIEDDPQLSKDLHFLDTDFSEWPDLAHHLSQSLPIPSLARRSWSGIRHHLHTWTSIAHDVRTDVILVVFAIATVLDDSRIFRAATKKAPQLQTEFINTPDDDEDSAPETHDVLQLWNQLCDSLRNLSEKASGPPPVVHTLDEIKHVVDRMSSIRQPVSEQRASILFDHLFSWVTALLDGLKAEQVFD